MVTLQVEFRPYRRSFRHPLKTAHGNWAVREGFILQLRDCSGSVSFGEIAPLPWFGTETGQQAGDFCRQLNHQISVEQIFSIPDHLPCCQFGFESALEGLKSDRSPIPTLPCSYLLPTGDAALPDWKPAWEEGYRTFKWKIGVEPIAAELARFHTLTQSLPASARLRLDANAGLSLEAAEQWLSVCDRCPNIEFVEQPLPPDQWQALHHLSQKFVTSIALDESIASFQDLQTCYKRGWRGVLVVKPAIAGSPSRLRQFCLHNQLDVVCSSVFETTVGQQAALRLAAELITTNRAVGFGVDQWFSETDPLACVTPEELWHRL